MKAIFVPVTVLVLASGQALAQSGDAKHPPMPMHAPTQSQMPTQGQMPMQGQMTGQGQPQMPMNPGSASMMASGEVRKIDKAAGKITLKHGPIANLDMPPMTMVFRVKDRAFLDRVKVGEKVRFAAEQDAGALTLTAIEPAS